MSAARGAVASRRGERGVDRADERLVPGDEHGGAARVRARPGRADRRRPAPASAVSSATTTSSEGPASVSIPTWPDHRLLGEGDVDVARADDDVDGADRLGAVRERGDRLGAPRPGRPRRPRRAPPRRASTSGTRAVRSGGTQSDDLARRRRPGPGSPSSAPSTGRWHAPRARSSRPGRPARRSPRAWTPSRSRSRGRGRLGLVVGADLARGVLAARPRTSAETRSATRPRPSLPGPAARRWCSRRSGPCTRGRRRRRGRGRGDDRRGRRRPVPSAPPAGRARPRGRQ